MAGINYDVVDTGNIPEGKNAYKVQLKDIAPDGTKTPMYPVTRTDDVVFLSSREYIGILRSNESLTTNLERMEYEVIKLMQEIRDLKQLVEKK